MERRQLIKELHPLEIRVLLHFKGGDSISSERLQQELGYKPGQSNQAFAWLEAKKLIEETERTKISE
jgi:phenylalanyl-tRNA synthetase alpha chain